MNRNLICLFFTFLLITNISIGQIHLDFDVLTIDNGFTSSRARTIIQDRTGFIWVGTWNGLNRYDGYECVVYQPGFRDSSSLSNREVTALLEDKLGYIWIGTTFGLNRLNPISNQIDVFPFENRILSLFEDRKGKIWVGTSGDGLYWLNRETGEKHQCLKSENINFIFEDSRNEFWVATDNGLIGFDRETNSYNRYLQRPDQSAGNVQRFFQVLSIVESAKGYLWVGTNGLGVVKITPNPNKSNLQYQAYKHWDGSGMMENYPIGYLVLDAQENLWAGTWGGGLCILEKKEQEKNPEWATFSVYRNDVNDPFSISGNNYISALYSDRSGTLWVGSSVINIANIGNSGITRYNTREIIDGRVVNNWVRTISGNSEGMVWLGSSDGIKQFDLRFPQHPVIKSIPNITYSCNGRTYSTSLFLAFLNDHQGYFWAGSDGAGLILFPNSEMKKEKPSSFIFFNEDTNPEIPGLNRIVCLTPSKKDKNVSWIGTIQSGLVKCINRDGSFSFVPIKAGNDNYSLSDNNIRNVLEDREGFVWIGTQHGLNRLDPKSGEIEQFYFSKTDTTTINDNAINFLFEDSNGDLWIGSNAGLNKKIETREKQGTQIRFKSYPQFDWINSDIILNILEDGHKNLWIGIYNGILKFDLEKEKLTNEYFNKEYQRIKIDYNSSWKSPDGKFYMGGGTGFLVFHPDSFLNNCLPPEVQITDFLIFNKKVVANKKTDGRIHLHKSITFSDSLKLSYKDEVFTFVFSALDFRSPGKSKYAYKLEGFDKEWNNVGNRNTATYTGIPPGKYTFMVKACNSQGEWSKQPKTVFLKITPPWWRTLVAYFAYFVLVSGMLYFFKRYSIIQVTEKSKMMLERVQFEKEHELNELKVHFFTNITHEFRTPLTLIIGPLQEMLDQKNKFGQYSRNLELISRNAHRLLRLINQLMEFRKVEKDKMELLLQEVDVVPILIEMYDSFQPIADSKNIDFVLQYIEPAIHAWIDRDKFDKVMFNLLSNAFKFTEEGGKIQIRAGMVANAQNGNAFFIEIDDTGIGIPDDKKELVFERFYQINQKSTQSTGGIGLYLSKAFVELHNGIITLVSDPGKGSCFKVVIPTNLKMPESPIQIPSPEITEKAITVHASNFDEEDALDVDESDRDLLSDRIHTISDRNHPFILLVEDDIDMNEFIRNSLSSYFKVRSSYNGKDALEIARRLNPDMVISDIMMPEMDGLELCRQLQTDINTSHIPILFLTAKTTRENEVEGLQSGAVDYITKPFSVVSLKLKIFNILAYRDSLKDNYRKHTLLEPSAITLTSLDDQFLKDAMAAVNKHLDNPGFDVEQLSQEIGLSSNQTYRKIKALTGQTAKEFIRNQRLKTSAQLLLQRKRTVSEIIYMVGFSSPSYFTRCFREYFGCTPSEYIEKDGVV